MHARLVTGLIVLAAAGLAGCSRLGSHPLVTAAVEEIGHNTRVAEALGGPVSCGTAVRGVANETDGIATLQFDAKGSKNTGVVVVEGKKTRGTWGITALEIQPKGGADISLTGDLYARIGIDTPKFDPSAGASSSKAPPPPSDIDIPLPPGPPETQPDAKP